MLRHAAMQDNNENKDKCQRYPRSCLHLLSYGGFLRICT